MAAKQLWTEAGAAAELCSPGHEAVPVLLNCRVLAFLIYRMMK